MVSTRTITYHLQYITIRFIIINKLNHINQFKTFVSLNQFFLLLFYPRLDDCSKFHLFIINLKEYTFFSLFKIISQIT